MDDLDSDLSLDLDFGIHSAASFGDTESLLKIIKNNNKLVNNVNQFGMTPLHGAAFHGHLEIVEILLKYDADPNHPSSGSKYTFPLHLATSRLHRPIIEILLVEGSADPSVKDYLGHTALDVAQAISVDNDSVAKDPYTNIHMMDFITECIQKQKSKNYNQKKSFVFESHGKISSIPVLPKVSICESLSEAGDYEITNNKIKSPFLEHFLKSDIF